MKVYLYCRVSTQSQSIERQIRNLLKEYPQGIVIQETYTGTTTDRKEWKKLFNTAAAGDTIVFDSVSRMSRNAVEGFECYEELFNRVVSLVFLKEKHINTDTYKAALLNQVELTGSNVDFIIEGINKYLLSLAKEQIKIAFEQAQKERDDLSQRTKEGLLTAKINGVKLGNEKGSKLTTKKSISAKEIIKKHSIDFGGTLSDSEVIKLADVSRKTFYKYKKELREEI